VAAGVLLLALCWLLVWGVLRCRRRYQSPDHNGPLTFRGFELFPVVKDLQLTHAPPTLAKKTAAEKSGGAKPLLPYSAPPSAAQGGGGLADWILGLDPTDAQVVQRHREEANRSLGSLVCASPRTRVIDGSSVAVRPERESSERDSNRV
jgi:hypothetical protein